MTSPILTFPSRPAARSASRLQVVRGRAVELLGRLLNRLGCGGVVREVDLYDDVSARHLQVRLLPTFVVLSIDGRDYWFNRFTGRFDGTGSGCPSQLVDYTTG